MSDKFWTARAVKYNNKLANLAPISYFVSDAFNGVGNTRVIINGLEDENSKFSLDLSQWRGIWQVNKEDCSFVHRGNSPTHNWEFAKVENFGPGINGRNNIQLNKGQELNRHWTPHSTKFNLSDGQFVKKTAEVIRNLACQNIGLGVIFTWNRTIRDNKTIPIPSFQALSDFRDVNRSYRVIFNELTPDAIKECDKLPSTKSGFDLEIAMKGSVDWAYGDEGQDFFASNIYNYMVLKDKAARELKSYDPMAIVKSAAGVANEWNRTPALKAEGFGKLEHLLANHYTNTFIPRVSDVSEMFGFLHYAIGQDGTYGLKFAHSDKITYSNRLGVFSAKQNADDVAFLSNKPFVCWTPTKKGPTKELADFVRRVTPRNVPYSVAQTDFLALNNFTYSKPQNILQSVSISDKSTKDLVAKLENLATRYYNNIGKTAVLYANEIDTSKLEQTLGNLTISTNSLGKEVYKLVNEKTKKEVTVIKTEKVPVMYSSIVVTIAANALARKLLGQNFEGFKYGMFDADPKANNKPRHYKNPVVSIQFLRQFQFLRMRLDRMFGLEETNFFHILKDAKHQREMREADIERIKQKKLAEMFDAIVIKSDSSPEFLSKRWQSATLLAQGQVTPGSKTVITTASQSPKQITTTQTSKNSLPILNIQPQAIKLATNVKPINLTTVAKTNLKGLSGYDVDGLWSSLGASPATTTKTATSIPKFPTLATAKTTATTVLQKPVVTAVQPSANNSAERTALLNFLNSNRSKLMDAKLKLNTLSAKRRAGKLRGEDVAAKAAAVKVLSDLANLLNPLEAALNAKNALIAQQELKTQAQINARFDATLKIISQKDIDLLKTAFNQTIARILALKEKVTSSEKDLLIFAQTNSAVLQTLLTTLQPLLLARSQNKATAASVISVESTLKAIKNVSDAFAEKQANVSKEIKETPITAATPEAEVVTPTQADVSVCAQAIPVSVEQAQQEQQAVAQVVAQQVPSTDSATPTATAVVEAPTQVGVTVTPISNEAVTTDATATVVPTTTTTTTTAIIPATATQPAQVVTVTTPTVVPPTDVPAPVIDASVSNTPQVAPPPAPEQGENGTVVVAPPVVDSAVRALEAQVASQPVQISQNLDTKSVAPATETSSEPKPTVVVTPIEVTQIKADENREEIKAEEKKAADAQIKVVEELKEENANRQPLVEIGPVATRPTTVAEENKEIVEIQAIKGQADADAQESAIRAADADFAKSIAMSAKEPASTPPAKTDESKSEKGMSTGAKVAVGGAVLAAIAGGLYFYNKNKSE